jgi:dihydropteroate synthase
MSFPAVSGLPQPGRTSVIGVVNVTPDSFSDGGLWFESRAAVDHGLELINEGADIVEVGGESTRPGANRPTVEEELRRVLPVVSELAATGAVVGVDSMRPEVVAQAVARGAAMVNDVSGGRADPAMLRLVAELQVPYVCMHWRGHSADMQNMAHYTDVVTEVITELRQQISAAISAGIAAERLIIDPGFGFAKTGEHNWQLLQRIGELSTLSLPVLAGVSRKAFLGTLLADSESRPRQAQERDAATTALTTILAEQGIWGVRVHSVRPNRDAIAVVSRLAESRG